MVPVNLNPECCADRSTTFFALRFGKKSSSAEHGEGGQCGFFMVFSLKLIEGVGLNGG
jgi:hypothetical protein